jgi:hypothetical protein
VQIGQFFGTRRNNLSMARMLVVIILGSLVCLAGLTREASAKIDTLTAMSEVEVRDLLSDVEIGPECCDRSEAFYKDGDYVHLGYAPDPGRYTVAGSRVCVTTEYRPKETCRRFYRDENGRAFAIKEGAKSAEAIDPRPAPEKSYWRSDEMPQ